MTLALAGDRRDAGVSIAEVNLKFIWDVVSQIKVGEQGQAYVVDAPGRLIAHPDISLVLRETNAPIWPKCGQRARQAREVQKSRCRWRRTWKAAGADSIRARSSARLAGVRRIAP